MPTSDNERLQQALVDWDNGPYMTFLKPSADILVEAAEIRAGHRILDVGAGFGDPSLDIAALVGSEGSVTGIDHDVESIEIAQKRADDRGLTNVVFQEMEIPELAFPAETFDAVISRNVVVYFSDPLPFLREQLRVLVPGGRIAVTVWGPNDNNPLMGLPMRVLRRYAPPPETTPAAQQQRINTGGVNVLEQALKDAGFINTKAGAVPLTPLVDADQAAAYWEQRRVGSPASQRILNPLPEERQVEAEAEVVETIRALIAEGRATGEMVWASGEKPSSST